MIRIREIDHLVLRVSDLERMLQFYCGALGCNIERRQDAIGLVQLRAGRSLIDLVPVAGKLGRAGGAAPGAGGRNLDHFCLRVEPFDEAAIREALQAQDIEVGPVESRYGAEGLGPSIYVTDPEGNVVELKGPSTGYSGTPLLRKLGIKAGSRVCARGAPADYARLLGRGPVEYVLEKRISRRTDVVHLFSDRKADLKAELERLRQAIRSDATVWVSWPRKASGVPTDITEGTIRQLALPLGFVDVKVCAVTEVWSGLKLVIRKELR